MAYPENLVLGNNNKKADIGTAIDLGTRTKTAVELAAQDKATALKNRLGEDKYNSIINELRARRLDQADCYNITDPITSSTKTIAVNTVSIIAVVGCHYSKQDYDNFKALYTKNGTEPSVKEIFAGLYTVEKYRKQTILRTFSDPDVIAWAESQGLSVDDRGNVIGAVTVSQSVTTSNIGMSPTPEQIETAKQNKVQGPSDSISQVLTGENKSTTLNEKEYVKWLCEVYNEVFRADVKKPQIPTSIGVSIALARTGTVSSNIGKFNFWKFPYDKELTSLDSDGGNAAFTTKYTAVNACLIVLRRSNFKTALLGLEDDMSKTTEENKQKVTKNILTTLSSATADDEYTKAMKYVQDYDLRSWDTDKSVAEGGHKDQTTNSNSESGAFDKIADKALQRVAAQVLNKGDGFNINPLGADHCEIIKLPVGKTPCEPIYPDYIQVGDTIPEWVFSDTYAKIAEAAEKSAFEAAGLKLDDTSRQAKISAFNEELKAFKEAQFMAWCNDNNISYNTEAEKTAAEKKYNTAAAEGGSKFKDGIYLPDSSSLNKYNALLEKRKSLTDNIATANAYSNYTSSLNSVKQEIAAREGNWNQDTGHAVETGNSLNFITNQTNNTNIGTSSSSELTAGGSTDAKLSKAIEWAIATARDQSHGYSQASRTGPDYDCSSFVSTALKMGGFNTSGSDNCDTLKVNLPKIGFKQFTWDNKTVDKLVPGDVLITASGGHTGLYIGNGKMAEATGEWVLDQIGKSSSRGMTGDQGNTNTDYEEIRITSVTYRKDSDGFTYGLRYPAQSSSSSGSSTSSKMETVVKWAESKSGTSYASFHKANFKLEDSSYAYVVNEGLTRDGPNMYDCSSLVYWSLINNGFSDLKAAWEKNARYKIFKDNGATQAVGDVDTLWTDLQQTSSKSNWKKLASNAQLQRGDIVVIASGGTPYGHIVLMSSTTKTIEARGTNYKTGNYDISGRSITEVYRYQG